MQAKEKTSHDHPIDTGNVLSPQRVLAGIVVFSHQQPESPGER
jgi:hypothetical protein